MFIENLRLKLQLIEWGCRIIGTSIAILAAAQIRTGLPINFTQLSPQQLYTNRHAKALIYLSSCGLLICSYRLSNINKKLVIYGGIVEAESQNQFRESLKSAAVTPLLQPSTTDTPIQPGQNQLQPFDWQLFNTQPEKYPHLFIVGGTGDGKSYTAESICYILEGKTIVIHPHKKPGDFQGFPCYCGGRKYGSWKQDKLTENDNFNRLLKGGEYPNLTCAKAIKLIHQEMDSRYKLYEQGIENYPMVNIIIDEYNTTVDAVPEITSTMNSLIREARKVKLRLILLIQSDLVDDLGIKGKGAIRKCFRFIRLGDFAKDRAKKSNSGSIKNWVSLQEYPLLVEDDIALLPDKKALPLIANSCTATTNASGNDINDGSNHVTSQLRETEQLEQLLDKNESTALPSLPLPENWVIANPKASELPDSVRGAIVAFIRAAFSKQQTINAIFGCKKNSVSKSWRSASYWYDEVKSNI
ncbi:MAG: hypothetical protein QNJ68_02825 [Microcoleaceae cyanobacterium MO_207.B10]|nr:hypothetical protein [Microcoleaceae cyanobacterium MO_207.B10]